MQPMPDRETPSCLHRTMAVRAGGANQSARSAASQPTPGSGPRPLDQLDQLYQLERAIDTIASIVACLDAQRVDGRQAMRLVASFTRCEHLGHAGKTLAAARAALAAPQTASGQRSAAHWLAEVTGESVGDAVRTLELGRRLPHQQALDKALRSGRLSRSRVQAVSDAALANPDEELTLVGAAVRDDHRSLRERCRATRARSLTHDEAVRNYELVRSSRYCRTWSDDDGAVRLEARLTPDAGAVIRSALESRTKLLAGEARRRGAPERYERLAADALVSMCRDGFTATTDGAGGAREGSTGPTPPAVVHVRVDVAALRRGWAGDGEVCEIAGVGPVPVESARSLLGDAWLKLVLVDGVDVATVCHAGRTIPAPVRTALIERDRTCVVPGCGSDLGLEIDHWRVPFAEGGPTSLANLARLCHHHHFLKTFRGFRLSGGPGRWVWHPPDDPIVVDDGDG